ncbi:UNVERIFIED_CONTAM: hypothetical protein Sangu_1175800 [Sesamum angustifolium]|uniref:Uncharacterized protein n=1 Tax=Sesamum angustifolium TaxID=2727405 RepID=A0AAW2NH36_9LAMI
MKAQALVEFVNEAMLVEEDERNWLLHEDGSSTLIDSGARVVFISPKGDELEYAVQFDFKSSNNGAKYEALIADWRKPLLDYFNERVLPADDMEAARLKSRATRFALLDGILYKRQFLNLTTDMCQ